ncbi:dienelactone hydrolase family protein [Rhizobium oryziradicis]|uniref:Carboxymethylenebutenolidase n=1 Tax=Rhizobium oryziradicis TaxID=1867956 RepID=A0A1Q8ZW50_9HYPH|nr:dienelactone hydrolase family protein [Rhizobium oryziradicis]OLP46118.1 carboxymethylenebutenolidase [Rhizobium oryziradicis]
MDKQNITQAMIDAYDEYTHLTLDRRGFMEKLSKLAGSGAAAAAIMPMLAASKASAALTADNDERLKIKMVTYPGAGGTMKGYLVIPKAASNPLPGVIVIHENRGLNPHIEDVARRLALEGFVALAPDFLSPLGGTPENEDAAREMFPKLDMATTIKNAEASRAYLSALKYTNGKIGAVGFCWGGGLVNQLAVASPKLGAGVAYYGMQPKAEQVASIKSPLMLHYAGLDERINAGIDAYKAALEANSQKPEIFIYAGVNHAFNNDTSAARYNKEAADLAWSRTLGFLKKHLD